MAVQGGLRQDCQGDLMCWDITIVFVIIIVIVIVIIIFYFVGAVGYKLEEIPCGGARKRCGSPASSPTTNHAPLPPPLSSLPFVSSPNLYVPTQHRRSTGPRVRFEFGFRTSAGQRRRPGSRNTPESRCRRSCGPPAARAASPSSPTRATHLVDRGCANASVGRGDRVVSPLFL